MTGVPVHRPIALQQDDVAGRGHNVLPYVVPILKKHAALCHKHKQVSCF